MSEECFKFPTNGNREIVGLFLCDIVDNVIHLSTLSFLRLSSVSVKNLKCYRTDCWKTRDFYNIFHLFYEWL